MLTPRKKKLVVKEHGIHETDTGSANVQTALLTRRIEELTAHLKKNPKDNHSRRGLLLMVGKRRRLLRYVEKKDKELYDKLTEELGIRK